MSLFFRLSLFVFLLGLMGCHPKIEDFREGHLTCRYFGRTPQTLAVRAENDDLIRLVDFDFLVSPFLPTYLSCSRWLESLPLKYLMKKTWRVRPTLSREKVLEGALDDPLAKELYQACENTPLCRVNFPYNLSWWRFKRLFKRGPANIFGGHQEFCQNEIQNIPPQDFSQIRPIEKEDISQITFWSTPESTFSDQVVRLINQKKSGTLFVSTMTLGMEDVENIMAALGRNPLITVYLLFDAPISAASASIRDWITFESDQLHFVPVAPRPDLPSFFHFKGASVLDGDRIIFTSANLNQELNSTLYDLGFMARGSLVAQALTKVLGKQIQQTCDQKEYLTCTLKARLLEQDPLTYQVEAALAKSCREFYDAGLPGHIQGLNNPFFLTTPQYDLMAPLKKNLLHSNRNIKAFTHRLDSWPLLKTLEKVKNQGVRVEVYAGRGGDHPIWEVPQFQGMLHVLQDKLPFEPHSKFILMDDELALWGTGNLTKNGLNNAAELFFLTKHPQLLSGLQEYAKNVTQALAQAETGGTS